MTHQHLQKWKFFLCENDTTMTQITELAFARNRQIEFLLNRPGSLSCSLSLEDPASHYVEEGTTCIKAYREGTCHWSGYVNSVEESMDANTSRISVTCAGWSELLNHRVLEPYQEADARTKPTDKDAGLVAYDLLALANEQTETGAPGGPVLPTGIIAGTRDPSQVRTRKYERYANIGQGIQELSDVEAGFDYWIDPNTRALNIDYDLIAGTIRGRGANRTNTLFSLGWGPNNLRSVTRVVNLDAVSNRVYATGKFGTFRADDVDSQRVYGLRTQQVSVSDITDPAMLGAFASAEVAVRGTPRAIYTIAPFVSVMHGHQGIGFVPHIFEDYDIGDIVYLSVKGFRQPVDKQAIRIFGASVSIDEVGNEHVNSIQTAPTG